MKRLKNLALNKMPWKLRDSYKYYRAFGMLPDLKIPKTFNEKVLYRKRFLCTDNENYTMLADKFLVREYVKSCVGEKYLIPLVEHFDDVHSLADVVKNLEHCVVKPNHGAGMVKVINDKLKEEEVAALLIEAESWLKTDFSIQSCEFHYQNIKRKLLIEKRIGDGVAALTDYKYHLFKQPDGSVFFVLQLIDDRFEGALSRTFYINNFTEAYSGTHEIGEELLPLVQQGLELSIKLLGDLEYARIDWYIHEDELYFGEVTLTPAAGFGIGYGRDLDVLMGNKWHMSDTSNPVPA